MVDNRESQIAVEVLNLRKTFDDVEAVRNVSFSIKRGDVVGFIGANGAGKTTTMRMMSTLDLPTSGKIFIEGFDVEHKPDEVRKRIGWMPDAYGVYEYITVEEYLDFYGRSYGYTSTERKKRVDEVMEFADLTPLKNRLMNKLSKGQAQRLCFGRMLVHDPDILILDEPAAGLDPKARIEFKNLIRILAGRGKTIFISSHILSELGEMCSSLIFIDEGEVKHQGTPDSLKKNGAGEGTFVEVEILNQVSELRDWAELNSGCRFQEEHARGARLYFETKEATELSLALKRMLEAGIQVVEFRREEIKLEDAFIQVLREKEKKE